MENYLIQQRNAIDEFLSAIAPLKTKPQDSIHFVDEIDEWLQKRGYELRRLEGADYDYDINNIGTSAIDFEYINKEKGIRIGFIGTMIHIMGWYEGEEPDGCDCGKQGEWTLLWSFSQVKSLEHFKAIIHCYIKY